MHKSFEESYSVLMAQKWGKSEEMKTFAGHFLDLFG